MRFPRNGYKRISQRRVVQQALADESPEVAEKIYTNLVLTRRCGEEICIADDVSVSVVEIRGNKVRLGINAPRDVRIDRREVRDRRQAEAV